MRWVGQLALVLMALAGGGCMWTGYAGEVENRPYTDRIIFSDDGQRVAYVWTDRCRSLIPYPPAMPIDTLAEVKTEWVGWCNPDGSNRLMCIDAQSHLGGGFGNLRSIEGLSFAPDGEHLAAVLSNRIEIIDTASGAIRRLTCPDGEFTRAGWFDNSQLIYVTTAALGCGTGADVRRSVYRQPINGGKSACLFTRTSPCDDAVHGESLAPDGQHVVLAEGPDLYCVSTEMGTVRRLDCVELTSTEHPPASLPSLVTPLDKPGLKPWHSRGAWWHFLWTRNGSQVAVLANSSATGWLLLAILIDSRTGQILDRTAAFRREVGERWAEPIAWTPDGFLLLRVSKPGKWGICFVRPDPWEVINFLDQYLKEIPRNGNGVDVVQPLQRGWLAIGPGEKDPMMYAVDYEGKKQVPVTKRPFAISPDGSRIAEVIEKGKVSVRTLTLSEK